MAWRGSDNLAYYLSQAILPPMLPGVGTPEMPRQGHGSHRNKLTVRPEPYRKLQSIYQLIEEAFNTLVLEWIEDHIPFESLGVEDEDEATGERLSVPANICCSIPSMPLNRPSEISRVSVWIDQLPLETVQRTMHLVYPKTQNWKFAHSDVIDIDKDVFDYFQWKDRSEPQNTRLVVVVQPPWILSPQDLQNFQECQLFPTCKGRDPALKSKNRLWGKIWDLCVRQNCPWFVVSTYNRWIFGSFSQGWTAAFVTPVFEWNFQCPTVLAALTYWTASAMGLPGTWDIPEVRETIQNLTPSFSIPPPNENEFSIVPSESSWAGGNGVRPIPSSVGLTASPIVSEAGLPIQTSPVDTYSSSPQFEDIQQWLGVAPQDNSSTLLHAVNPPSPAGTVNTAWSELTADAGESVANFEVDSAYHGDWMSLPFSRRAAVFQLAE